MGPWTCQGVERGPCGVTHATHEEAIAHVQADHAANGWTDRYVVDQSDGATYGITKAGELAPVTPAS